MMTADTGTSPELLAAEIAAIEDLLMNYEDWRAWAQLEARERSGELPPSVAASGLKTLLLDKLAVNPLFIRRQALVKQMEQVAAQARNKVSAQDDGDDLTRISGIDARLERRLNNLAVRKYAHIAAWTPLDVNYFASTLGLGDLISSQMWIAQAGALMRGGVPAAPIISLAPVQVAPPSATPATVVPAVVRVVPEPVAAKVAVEPEPRMPVPPPSLQDPEALTAPKVKASPAQPIEVKVTPASSPPPAQSKPPAAAVAEVPAANTAAQVAKQATAAAPASVEPAYPLGKPAKPLPASTYRGYVPPAPALVPASAPAQPIKVAAVAAAAPAPEPVLDTSSLSPAFAAPAWYYEGAAVEPPHEAPIAVGAVPAPMPARGFATPPEREHLAAEQPVRLTTPSPVHTPSAPVAAAAGPANAPENAKRGADILAPNLPPLPLMPAKAAEPKSPPPLPVAAAAAGAPKAAPAASLPPPVPAEPTPAQVASVHAAAAAAAASAGAVAAAGPPKAASAQAVPPAPAVKTPDELLRAATARAAAMAAVPPPVPPLPPKAVVIQEEGPSYAAAPEARVTIRRGEDAPSSPVIRVPGATDVHLARRQHDKFDGSAYAAYHSEIEEASVQIVRKPGTRTPPNARPLPQPPPSSAHSMPGPSIPAAQPVAIVHAGPGALPAAPAGAPPPLNAAEAAARAAAALSASAQTPRAPAQPAPVRAPEPTKVQATEDPLTSAKKGAEKAAQTMGRFLKALTGQ